MSDIVEFVKARLDEDEQVALTSIGKHPERAEWSYEPYTPGVDGSGEVIAPNDRDDSGYPELITRDMEGLLHAVEEKDGPHIARHHPARVLREVAAKRKVVEDHYYAATPESCSRCVEDHDAYPMPCPTIRALASVYCDHPDYRQEWEA